MKTYHIFSRMRKNSIKTSSIFYKSNIKSLMNLSWFEIGKKKVFFIWTTRYEWSFWMAIKNILITPTIPLFTSRYSLFPKKLFTHFISSKLIKYMNVFSIKHFHKYVHMYTSSWSFLVYLLRIFGQKTIIQFLLVVVYIQITSIWTSFFSTTGFSFIFTAYKRRFLSQHSKHQIN